VDWPVRYEDEGEAILHGLRTISFHELAKLECEAAQRRPEATWGPGLICAKRGVLQLNEPNRRRGGVVYAPIVLGDVDHFVDVCWPATGAPGPAGDNVAALDRDGCEVRARIKQQEASTSSPQIMELVPITASADQAGARSCRRHGSNALTVGDGVPLPLMRTGGRVGALTKSNQLIVEERTINVLPARRHALNGDVDRGRSPII
jgi:hypothetical protein